MEYDAETDEGFKSAKALSKLHKPMSYEDYMHGVDGFKLAGTNKKMEVKLP